MGAKLSYRKVGECDVEMPSFCGLVIFGASGDLTKRKLIPSLYHLHHNGLLPEDFFVLGTGRTEMSTEQMRDLALSAVRSTFPGDLDKASWEKFAARLYYFSLDYSLQVSYKSLGEKLASLEARHHTAENRIFYLATPPTTFEIIIDNLGAVGLSKEDKGYSRIVIEKPFGRDLETAKRLNSLLRQYFDEKQIYRIDHYLAKETVQDILMFRFANSLFEPLWNNKYIDHIQITAAETLGVEERAGYYEDAGVIRDMFPNHMFHLLALTAMEPPVTFKGDPVRDEKVKVFHSIRPFPLDRLDEYVIAGQYRSGRIDGNSVVGYREELEVSNESITPTFAAIKIFVDNWRWKGVPFYLRSGKRLSSRKTEISIHFKPVPHMMFSHTLDEPISPNVLVLRVQPDEGISLIFQAKLPGSRVCLRPVIMNFSYQGDLLLDAYEWVLLDCMQGGHILSVREDGVEQAWALLTPLINRIESTVSTGMFPNYVAGSTGPDEAAMLIEKDGRKWLPL